MANSGRPIAANLDPGKRLHPRSSFHIKFGGFRKLACNFRDKSLMAYICHPPEHSQVQPAKSAVCFAEARQSPGLWDFGTEAIVKDSHLWDALMLMLKVRLLGHQHSAKLV